MLPCRLALPGILCPASICPVPESAYVGFGESNSHRQLSRWSWYYKWYYEKIRIRLINQAEETYDSSGHPNLSPYNCLYMKCLCEVIRLFPESPAKVRLQFLATLVTQTKAICSTLMPWHSGLVKGGGRDTEAFLWPSSSKGKFEGVAGILGTKGSPDFQSDYAVSSKQKDT